MKKIVPKLEVLDEYGLLSSVTILEATKTLVLISFEVNTASKRAEIEHDESSSHYDIKVMLREDDHGSKAGLPPDAYATIRLRGLPKDMVAMHPCHVGKWVGYACWFRGSLRKKALSWWARTSLDD